MRELILDSGGEGDRAGFAALFIAVGVVKDLPAAAWRVVGGWMVRAWTAGGGQGGASRPTVDVDLELLPQRAANLAGLVPSRLSAAGLKPTKLVIGRGILMMPAMSPPCWQWSGANLKPRWRTCERMPGERTWLWRSLPWRRCSAMNGIADAYGSNRRAELTPHSPRSTMPTGCFAS